MSTRALLVVVLSFTLLALVVAAAPTTTQILSELEKLKTKLNNVVPPRYIIMSQVVDQLIVQGETAPASINWSFFAYNTLLIPTDSAIQASGLLAEPKTPEDLLNLFTSISYNIVRGMHPFSKIKKLAVGKAVALVLKNGKLFRRTWSMGWGPFKVTKVAFALKGKKQSAWSIIVDKDLNTGPSFAAQGVNLLQTTGP